MTTNLNTDQLAVVAEFVLTRMRRLGNPADLEAAAILHDVGYSRPSTDGSGISGGSTSSVVERAIASPEMHKVRAWQDAKLRLARALQEIDHAITNLLPANEAEYQAPGSGECGACARWVAGSATDRIRAGLCDACRQWVKRAMAADHRLDRGEAILARRRHLAEPEPAA